MPSADETIRGMIEEFGWGRVLQAMNELAGAQAAKAEEVGHKTTAYGFRDLAVKLTLAKVAVP